MIQNSCRMLSSKHFTFDLYHCLISFLIFLWCRTDDLSSLLLCFCSLFVSLSIHSSLLLDSLLLFLVLFVIPSMFLLSQSSLCLAYDVLQFNLRPLWVVVAALLMVENTGTRQKEGKVESGGEKETEVKKLIPESTQTPPPSWQIWDLIGSSLLHVFCLVMLFVAYSWSEFK